MKKITVLIVDDHNLVRDGIRSLLGLIADVEVIGEAADGKEALERVAELRPEVVLMDLAMPVLSGLDATRRIRKEFPSTQVIALTQHDDSEYVLRVIEAGARGFISKSAAFAELASALHAVAAGKSFLSPVAASALVKDYQEGAANSAEKDPYQRLSNREKEVLALVVDGYTTRQIADMLFISPKTVEWHKTSLMSKLNIHNRTGLVKFAVRRRLTTI